MRCSTRYLLAAGLSICLSSLGWVSEAQAMEHITPYLQGSTTGQANGALPDPGLYFSDSTYFLSGRLITASGEETQTRGFEAANAPGLIWVPGWTIFGAKYAFTIVQPYAERNTNTDGVSTPITGGLFNTEINPIILSWYLGDHFYDSAGFRVYLPDGLYKHNGAMRLPRPATPTISGHSSQTSQFLT